MLLSPIFVMYKLDNLTAEFVKELTTIIPIHIIKGERKIL